MTITVCGTACVGGVGYGTARYGTARLAGLPRCNILDRTVSWASNKFDQRHGRWAEQLPQGSAEKDGPLSPRTPRAPQGGADDLADALEEPAWYVHLALLLASGDGSVADP